MNNCWCYGKIQLIWAYYMQVQIIGHKTVLYIKNTNRRLVMDIHSQTTTNIQEKSSMIWGIADLIRDYLMNMARLFCL